MGLPKSGTTSLSYFLNEVNRPFIRAVHYSGYDCEDKMFPIPAVRIEGGIVWPELDINVRAPSNGARNGWYVAFKIQRALAEYLLQEGFNAFTEWEVAVFDLSIWP